MYIADHQTPWEYLWIEFDGLRAKGMLETAGFSLDSPIYHARKKELREEMKSEMLHIIEHGDAPPFHLIGHLYLFLDYLVRSAAALKVMSNSTLRDFYIHEALEYIEHNCQNNIKGGGAAQADLPLHRRHRKRRGLSERPAFFQSL